MSGGGGGGGGGAAAKGGAGESWAERAARAARAEELELAQLAELAELTALVDSAERGTAAGGADAGNGNGCLNGRGVRSLDGSLGGGPGKVDVATGSGGEGEETEDDDDKGDGRALSAVVWDPLVLGGTAGSAVPGAGRRQRRGRGAAAAEVVLEGLGRENEAGGCASAGGVDASVDGGSGAGAGARAEEAEVGLLRGEAESGTPRWREDAAEGDSDYMTDDEPPYHLRVEERRRSAVAAAANAAAAELVDPHAQRHLLVSLLMHPLDCPVLDDDLSESDSGRDGESDGDGKGNDVRAVRQRHEKAVEEGSEGGAGGARKGAACSDKGAGDGADEAGVVTSGAEGSGVASVIAGGFTAGKRDAGSGHGAGAGASAGSEGRDGRSGAFRSGFASFVKRSSRTAVPVSRKRLLAIARFRARHKRLQDPTATPKTALTGPLLWTTHSDARALPFAPPDPSANAFHLERLFAIRAFHRRLGSYNARPGAGKKAPHLAIWPSSARRVVCNCCICTSKSAGPAILASDGRDAIDNFTCTFLPLAGAIEM